MLIANLTMLHNYLPINSDSDTELSFSREALDENSELIPLSNYHNEIRDDPLPQSLNDEEVFKQDTFTIPPGMYNNFGIYWNTGLVVPWVQDELEIRNHDCLIFYPQNKSVKVGLKLVCLMHTKIDTQFKNIPYHNEVASKLVTELADVSFQIQGNCIIHLESGYLSFEQFIEMTTSKTIENSSLHEHGTQNSTMSKAFSIPESETEFTSICDHAIHNSSPEILRAYYEPEEESNRDHTLNLSTLTISDTEELGEGRIDE